MYRLLFLVSLVLAQHARATVSEEGEWQFRVLLDDREIGYHEFEISRSSDNGLRVRSEARFDVKVLFVNVFSYRHENVEEWDSQCLSRIRAETDANGKDFRVTGEQAEGGFQLTARVERDTDSRELAGCVRTFAYWNRDLLNADRLLNTQTGEYEDVSVSREGQTTLSVRGQPVPAVEYRLNAESGAIRLWYHAEDGRWLALESEAAGGRRLRYEPVSLPDQALFAVKPGTEISRFSPSER